MKRISDAWAFRDDHIEINALYSVKNVNKNNMKGFRNREPIFSIVLFVYQDDHK